MGSIGRLSGDIYNDFKNKTGMNGWELAKKMLEIRPGIKLLFTSGYISATIAHNSVIEEGIHFIQRPFTLRDLSTQLRKAREQQTQDA